MFAVHVANSVNSLAWLGLGLSGSLIVILSSASFDSKDEGTHLLDGVPPFLSRDREPGEVSLGGQLQV